MTNQPEKKPDWAISSQEKYDPEKRMPNRSLVEVISGLLREKGILRYEELDGSSEGDVLPGNVDEVSGAILVDDGRVFCYWLGWDPDKTAPDGTKGWYTLGENFKDPQTGDPYPLFEEILPGSEAYPKPGNSSFIAAKQKLGLA